MIIDHLNKQNRRLWVGRILLGAGILCALGAVSLAVGGAQQVIEVPVRGCVDDTYTGVTVSGE